MTTPKKDSTQYKPQYIKLQPLEAHQEPRKQQPVEPILHETFGIEGLYLHGRVVGRSRMAIAKEGKEPRMLIKIAVQTKGGVQNVERWCEALTPDGLPVAGDEVSVPVEARAFVNNGVAHIRLGWRGAGREEAF